MTEMNGQDCSSLDPAQRTGLCSDGTGIQFFVMGTLPSGGTAMQKPAAQLPGNSRSASFFFALTNDTAGIFSSGTVNEDYGFECKKNAETTFAPCSCAIPNLGSWEMCQQYTGLDRAGTMNFVVRAYQLTLDESTGQYVAATRAVVTPSASFTWTVDTVKPIAFIGSYYDPTTGGVLGSAPAPCSSAHMSPDTIFEISMNEPNGFLSCRLSNWVQQYKNFDNAMERWSALSVQLWLADPKHTQAQQVQRNLTVFQTMFAMTNGSEMVELDDAKLQGAPYHMAALADRLSLLNVCRMSISLSLHVCLCVYVCIYMCIHVYGILCDYTFISLFAYVYTIVQAIGLQRKPFQPCRSSQDVSGGISSAGVKQYDSVDLGDGLKLFELKATDSAGNIGDPVEYIWYSDQEAPKVVYHFPVFIVSLK